MLKSNKQQWVGLQISLGEFDELVITSNGSIDLTLGKIPVTSAPLGFLYLATHEPVYLSITDQIIDKIAIQLQDENGNDLELNGITNWSLTLTVHHEYLKPIKDYENTHGQDVKKTDVKK